MQEKIDTARNYYQQLLFRYTKETSSEDQGSRHNATLHKALKTVKDFGEKIRSFEVLNNQTKINVWTVKPAVVYTIFLFVMLRYLFYAI